jgi:ceramide glucosyltransferase
MANSLVHGCAALCAAATVVSIGYCGLSVVAGLKYRTQRRQVANTPEELPAVTILKPLKGADPDLYEALRSHCLQEYPEYELLFGITDQNDPAAALVNRLVSEYPQREIRLVLCDKRLGANGKVSSLVQLERVGRHGILIVNDSDIRVEPNYLKALVNELQRPNTGMVTCLYRGVPEQTPGSKLEALGIATDFAPGVLSAWLLEGGLRFGLGSTLAFRRQDLEAIGGFESILEYLADDYELGNRIAKRNLKIELSRSVVETHLPAYDLKGFLSHQLRWARTIRASRPAGYAGLLLTFTLPWALATLLFASGSPWSGRLLVVALIARYLMAWMIASPVLNDNASLRYGWMLPIRDCLAALVWIGGLLGRKIVWRGEVFRLEGGILKPTAKQ